MTPPRLQVTKVSFEHVRDPMGIGTGRPRISWQLQGADGWEQASYEIKVVRQHLTRIHQFPHSAEQLLVPWPDLELLSREQATICIRVTGKDGSRSGWSEPTTVEAGLLSPTDWEAAPVRGAWPEESGTDRRPSRVRRAFTIDRPVASARLYASAHGVFAAEINGRQVGDDTLSPGWTNYRKRLRYRTYDVTPLLNRGENMIGAWLGDGWYRGRLGFNGGYHDLYGQDLSFIGQLEIQFDDGTRTVLATDATWEAAPSPITFSGLYDGERYDSRLDDAGWSTPGASGSGWSAVAVGTRDMRTMVAAEGPPVRATEELAPVQAWKNENGTWTLDFGQNLVGRLRIPVRGPSGHTIAARHAEVLQGGRIYRRPLRLAAAEDSVISNGKPFDWEPRFTLHGFRYAEIEGFEDLEQAPRVIARVYHSDMERTGWFTSSNELLNRLHENVRWSMRGNFVDIPTDCPQRDERLGWTGDIQVFAGTASFLYDCSGLLSSWLQDLASEQEDSGNVPWYIPWIPGGPTWDPPQPSAVWGDASILVPYTLHNSYADRDILARQYQSGVAWLNLVEKQAGPSRIWRSGQQLGDWLDPSAPPEDPADAATDRNLVATAYFAHSAYRLAQIADVLGKATDAIRYRALAEDVRSAFADTYVVHGGRLSSDAQTAYSLAIVFNLVNEDLAQSFGDRLAELVAESGNRIGTGFAGTPVVTEALTRTGHVETAYNLLLEQGCPSWLYTVLQGGTTIWERWDSLLPDGTVNPGDMTSFNHYALGAVAEWMHGTIAGIMATSPGYRTVRFAPVPGGGLAYAGARHQSPYGLITSDWRLEDGAFTLTVALPIGTSGNVHLPDGTTRNVGPGRHAFDCLYVEKPVKSSTLQEENRTSTLP